MSWRAGPGRHRYCSPRHRSHLQTQETRDHVDGSICQALLVGDNAWVVRNVLSPQEAAAMASAAEAHGFEHATSRGPKFGEANRNHGRAAFGDGPLAKALWTDTVGPGRHDRHVISFTSWYRCFRRFAVVIVGTEHLPNGVAVDSQSRAWHILLATSIGCSLTPETGYVVDVVSNIWQALRRGPGCRHRRRRGPHRRHGPRRLEPRAAGLQLRRRGGVRCPLRRQHRY